MVDAFISFALKKLERLGEDELKLLCGTREEVDKLSDTLKVIHPYLRDIEVRQYFKDTEDPKVEDWLTKLKYVAYEADDVLDEWQTKSRQLWSPQLSASANLVWNFFAQCTCFHQLALSHSVGKKIQKINGKLDHIVTLSKKFDFLKSSPMTTLRGEETNFSSFVRNARKTTSSIEEVFGREDEIKRIKDMLMSSTSCSQTSSLAVASIVGPPGFGKTTLAKYVFNDGEIVQHFKERIWVCVSDEFDEASIMRKMIEAVKEDNPSVVEPEALKKILVGKILEDKTFLLVLDDVWNEDYGKWEKFYSIIKSCGTMGSQILVTTRSKNVCKVMGSAHMMFQVGTVSSPKHCWSIFESVAFESRDESECRELREVGKEIVKKCNGVPLAIKTVAGVLRTKNTIKDWENVLKSNMWDWQPKENTGIWPALLLSYYYLSPPLKQCFQYCAIYPKDHCIYKDVIVPQWIAQGYIPEKKDTEMEDVAKNYFDELLALSLFQEPELDEDDNIMGCKMHDLVHDLAQYVTKGEFLHINNKENIDFDTQYPPLHCNILIMGKIDDGIILKLRTFMSTSYEEEVCICDSQIEKMRHLRVLEFKNCRHNELPDVVGKLLHLRYLNLWGLKFKTFPSSIEKLSNLLYLYLCKSSIEVLPESIGMLRNLRHVYLVRNENLKALPNTIGRLINLKKLIVRFSALVEIPNSIGKLGSLQFLAISFCQKLEKLPESIKDLSSLQALDVSRCGKLKKLPESIKDLSNLQALDVSWCRKLEQLPAGVFEKMTGLKELRVGDSGLQGLPAGIGKLTDLQRLNSEENVENDTQFLPLHFLQIFPANKSSLLCPTISSKGLIMFLNIFLQKASLGKGAIDRDRFGLKLLIFCQKNIF